MLIPLIPLILQKNSNITGGSMGSTQEQQRQILELERVFVWWLIRTEEMRLKMLAYEESRR